MKRRGTPAAKYFCPQDGRARLSAGTRSWGCILNTPQLLNIIPVYEDMDLEIYKLYMVNDLH